MHVGLFFKFKQKLKYFLKFIHQFYQFENEYLPEYFKNVFIFISRGNQACVRIANSKRTTQSRDAELSAIYIEGTLLDLWTGAVTLATSSLLWKQQWNSWHLLRNNEQIFPDFMDITVWIWMKLMPKLTLYFCPQCVQMTGIFVFLHGRWGYF